MANRCSACTDDRRFIEPYGPGESRIAVVGDQPITEHPDESDAVFGLDMDPRVRSGKILERVFGELDVEIDDVYWTNAFKCPGDRPDACLGSLRQELRPFGQVIALGNATGDAMEAYHIEYDVKLWHPAYILRNSSRFAEYVAKWETAVEPPTGQSGLGDFG